MVLEPIQFRHSGPHGWQPGEGGAGHIGDDKSSDDHLPDRRSGAHIGWDDSVCYRLQKIQMCLKIQFCSDHC